MEKIEEAVRKYGLKRMPQMNGAGLLKKTLQRSFLGWLLEAIPEDIYQEAALFLLNSPDPDDLEKRKEFFREGSRHFYEVAVKYGFSRPRDSSWRLKEESMSDLSFGDESRTNPDPLQNIIQEERVSEALDLTVDISTPSGRQRARAQIALRDEAWEEDGKLKVFCGLCGHPLRFKEANIDHIIPRNRGGKDELENLQLAHEACNVAKGDRLAPIVVSANEKFSSPKESDVSVPRRIIVFDVDPETPLSEIMERFGVSKATASRIRKRGWFMDKDYIRHGHRTCGEKFFLTREEREISTGELRLRFGITYKTAQRAKKRGYFEITTSNRHLVEVSRKK